MFTKQKKIAENPTHSRNEVSLAVLSEVPNLFRYAANGDINELEEFEPTTLSELDENGATLLHCASVHNQTTVMQYLIHSCRLDIDAVDNDGNTSLHVATIHANIEAVHVLLDSGAKDTVLNKAMDAPLHIAVRVNDPKLVQTFVNHANVEILQPGPNGNTPFHITAMHDNIEAFKVLCESRQMSEAVKRTEGYKISCKNADGLTSLHVAARNGSHRVLEIIIKTSQVLGNSTEVELELLQVDANGVTPLYTAVEAGHKEVVDILLSYGAVPTKSYRSKIPPLHLACAQGKLEMVQTMVEHFGRDILTRRDQYGRLPLTYATIPSHGLILIAFLASNGVDLDTVEDDGLTALHFAVKCGNLASVKELLSRGANPLVKDVHGRNAAHYSIVYCRKKILEVLVTHEAFSRLFTDKDNDGFCAILLALHKGHGDLVLPLLSSHRIELPQSMLDADNNNCLHLAALSNDWRTLRALLDIPDFVNCVNATNSKAETPLHLAAQGGETRSVEILLNHGALTNKSLGNTALMRACLNGHSKCVLLLHNAHPFQRDWKDKAGNTALHHAALGGDSKTLGTALDIGCQISRNTEGLTFIDIIINSANKRCALVTVGHDRWRECLEYPSNFDPMIGLVQKLPSVAKYVLDRCHECSPRDRGHVEYWEKFDFKYLQPLRMSQRAERHKSVNESESSSLFPEQTRKEKTNSMTTLRKMVKHKCFDLLLHPVVEKYIASKWNTYGLWVYLLSFSLRLTAAILLSTFILVVPHPDLILLTQEANDSNSTESTTLPAGAQALRVSVLVTNFFLTLLVLLPLTATIKKLLTKSNLPILIYIFSILCTYIFLLTPNPTDVWIVGALATFFAWLAVTMALLFFEVFGIYVKMFLTVTATLFKVLCLSFFLILAFVFPFYILAAPFPFFSSIGYSLFTLFSYMLGEVQYELIILEDQSGSLNYSPLVFMFTIVVAILMSVAMANLLIGLAVGDIEGIRGTALVEKRKLHVLYLTTLENSPIFRRFYKPYVIEYPNRRSSAISRLWHCFRNITSDEDMEETSDTNSVTADHTIGSKLEQEEVSRMGQQLEELTLLVKQLCEQQSRHCPKCQNSL